MREQMKKGLSFYEFVGVFLPGGIFLFGLGFCYDGLEYLMRPEFGSPQLGLFLFAAYIVGHLIQGVGNMLEWLVYLPTGKPTYWITWKKPPFLSNKQREMLPDALARLTGWDRVDLGRLSRRDVDGMWGQLFARLRTNSRTDRLDIFVGNFGLFRGAAAALLIVAIVNAFVRGPATPQAWIIYSALVLSLFRMHRFSMHYASEFYRQILDLSLQPPKEET